MLNDFNSSIDEEEYFIIGFTPTELDILSWTTGVSAALSLIGSGMILGTYIGLPGTRSFAFQMVFMLSLCDFLSSLAFLIALGSLLWPCVPCRLVCQYFSSNEWIVTRRRDVFSRCRLHSGHCAAAMLCQCVHEPVLRQWRKFLDVSRPP